MKLSVVWVSLLLLAAVEAEEFCFTYGRKTTAPVHGSGSDFSVLIYRLTQRAKKQVHPDTRRSRLEYRQSKNA